MNDTEGRIAGPDDMPINAVEANPPAWEEIAPGRFMPRRVRGSCQGRALG
jgi:hypothetical protein